MKSLITGLAFFFTLSAQADIIKCTFTEPFLDFEYSMTQSKLTVNDPISDYPNVQKTVTKNVSFQIMGPGLFELWDKDKNVVAKLSLDNQGSDGMSDFRFPYSVEWNGLFGGCTSNFLSATENGWE